MHIRSIVLAALTCLLAPGVSSAVLDPAIKCQAAKLKLAGKYASCRLLEDAAALKASRTPDYSTCDEKITTGWQKVEASLGTECPSTGDLEEVQDSLVECIPTTRYLIRIGVVSTHTFGAVQIRVDYANAGGGFEGSGNSVSCTASVPGTLNAWSDYEDVTDLVVGTIGSPSNFASPVELATCIFESATVAAPVEGNFVLSVDDAADPNGNPIAGVQPGIVIEKLN